MKAKNNSKAIEFTRGSEIWIHQFRMFISSMMNVIVFGLMITIGIVCAFLYIKLKDVHFLALNVQYDIWLKSVFNNPDARVALKLNGVVKDYTLEQAQHIINPYFNQLKFYVFRAFILGILLSSFLVGGLIYYWFTYGKEVMSDEQIRGSELVSNDALIYKIHTTKGFSPYKISNIPMVKNTEGTNVGIFGAPGSGKSQIFRDHLSQVRANKKKAMVYDPSGEFTAEFYRPDKDFILNPFDARMPYWSPFFEIRHDEHFDSIANAFIPVEGKDPYFGEAGRTVMAEVMRELHANSIYSNKTLHDTIAHYTIKEISSVLEGTAASKHVDEKAEKTALAVLTTVQNKLRAFRYLPDSGTKFSIRDWVSRPDEDSWVFLSLREEQKTTIEPLITLWFSIFIKSVMNLDPVHRERLWMECDEFPALPKMDVLPLSLTNTRKYGLCHFLGLQDIPQLEEKYGEKVARSIISALQTKVFYRVNENETAKRMSEILGQMEVAEKNMSRSMGVNDSRDGDSFITQRRERFIVLPSEIMKLPDLTGYLRVPGDYPVTKITQKYHPHLKNVPAFIERENMGFISAFAVAEALESHSNSVEEDPLVEQPNEDSNFFGNSTEALVGESNFFGISTTTPEIIYEASPLDLFHSQKADSDLPLNEHNDIHPEEIIPDEDEKPKVVNRDRLHTFASYLDASKDESSAQVDNDVTPFSGEKDDSKSSNDSNESSFKDLFNNND
ncbi:type IV secretion system DNA-binding domain-containing protein [Acinetobacter seifertii]|uniref:type IV secretion system DNA-binding domain-containing protein n=1 Tax=Acinetobacter seifertii TaxID=1530123 RepID=UPI000C21C39E|nr:type IV secretion system DNA-binding domain-containing protein [Acinetobacter seifertii]PJG65169.1 type IV secretion system protein VirD4 [Acinetobacter seifertii]